MKIAIVTTGRFHVLDLARELSALGHEVAFYSYVPRKRALKFGLPQNCHRPLLPYVMPLVAALRVSSGRIKRVLDHMLLTAVDYTVSLTLEPCDVFIGMSGLCVKSAISARKKYSAKILIERGSRHILSQKEILDNIPTPSKKKGSVPSYAVRRELKGYEIADVIVIPSKHVEESFLERGVPKNKLFRNPYGVDLTMFSPTPVPPLDPPTILFVGGWSYQKGCDILVNAWTRLNGVHLMHVGGISDASLPKAESFTHIDPVPQWKLMEYYSKAHVFVLPSRQEGLSLVMAQALACGLPVVCTDRTGGEDIKEMIGDSKWITVVPSDDVNALVDAIRKCLVLARKQRGLRDILGPGREKLSWKAYGERYSNFLSNFNK
ncbi:MAG: glycosyltransferase family 4 protein [Deltaproteobacteria bacterium]|nr:glycosyltransferase family 4 protein [Deltaproteobacteria bacterium]